MTISKPNIANRKIGEKSLFLLWHNCSRNNAIRPVIPLKTLRRNQVQKNWLMTISKPYRQSGKPARNCCCCCCLGNAITLPPANDAIRPIIPFRTLGRTKFKKLAYDDFQAKYRQLGKPARNRCFFLENAITIAAATTQFGPLSLSRP